MEEEQTLSMLETLDWDTAKNIIRFLSDPADIIRLASASRSCRRFVIESKCAKELCIGICPEVSIFSYVVEEDKMNIYYERYCTNKDAKWDNLKREHRIYGMLAHELMAPPAERSCISDSICASSTDHYPEESIIYTLDPMHTCYWSSKGQINNDAPETLTYELCMNLCAVHEVNIRPFRAYFQMGAPIYSANAVRFRFGYSSLSPCEDYVEEYVWTYVSPEYPMQQEDKLQTFKLPRPVLCIGGILQVEFLGGVQKQEIDGLYYICVCHVHVVGRPLPFEALCQSRNCILKYSENNVG